MDFSFTKQDQLFLQMIREFAEKEVKPLAAEVDEEERFPMETVEKSTYQPLLRSYFGERHRGTEDEIPSQACQW